MSTSLLAAKLKTMSTGALSFSAIPTRELYESVVEEWIRSDLNVVRDLDFGVDPRQKLDVYIPVEPLEKALRPVVVFVHQGGFITGDKGDIEAINVGKFFAAKGMVCAVINYRLPPTGVWPASVEDVGSAMAWTWENIAKYGGDRERLFLFGHSSGATHAATYLLHQQFAAKAYPCRGLILAAGRYRLPPLDPNPELIHNFGRHKIRQYFGADPTLWPSQQVLSNVVAPECPVFVLQGIWDNLTFELNAVSLIQELLEKSHRMPRFLQIPHHNHLSYFFHLGTSDDPAGPQLLDFIESALAERPGEASLKTGQYWYDTADGIR